MTNTQIKLIIGPMFSCKTTELIRTLERFEAVGFKTVAIKHEIDLRYGDDCTIETHSGIKYPAFQLANLMSGLADMEKYDIIGIDEGQFFSDLHEFVTQMAFHARKTVIISALSGTYEQKIFSSIADVIPLATEIVTLTAICRVCRIADAPYTVALGEMPQTAVKVGGSSDYMPVCLHCLPRITKVNVYK